MSEVCVLGIHLESGLLCTVEFAVPQWSRIRHASCLPSDCKNCTRFWEMTCRPSSRKLGSLVCEAVVSDVSLLFHPTVGDRPRDGDELLRRGCDCVDNKNTVCCFGFINAKSRVSFSNRGESVPQDIRFCVVVDGDVSGSRGGRWKKLERGNGSRMAHCGMRRMVARTLSLTIGTCLLQKSGGSRLIGTTAGTGGASVAHLSKESLLKVGNCEDAPQPSGIHSSLTCVTRL